MGKEDSFDSTTLDMVFHYFLILTGFLAIFSVFSPIRFLFRKHAPSPYQSCRSEQKKLGAYRWVLTAIVISGLLWDVHISIFTAPFPVLPHIAFWADGLLVYIHPRMVVYLLAFALFLIFFWLTTLLLAFLYRFHAIVSEKKKKLIHLSAYFVVAICVVNSLISCGILIIRYPPESRILCALTESNPEMLFLYRKPAFIYFVVLDEFLFARIGLAHISVSLFFYLFVFLFVLISIHLVRSTTLIRSRTEIMFGGIQKHLVQSLSKLHAVMSANTIQMHRTLIKALIAQMVLPMGSLCLPLIGAAGAIKFGTILPPSLSKIGGQFGLMVTCLHSPLNTVSMILYVRPF
ncbi:hypothetical protein PRIPAC_97290, partial [Pristionchus pacificus]|uniref:G protein-coupled receptor n=1 Tax=Pristionchus pacificus TaxID=54126 RepID=A0A2A6CH69_PRIPA